MPRSLSALLLLAGCQEYTFTFDTVVLAPGSPADLSVPERTDHVVQGITAKADILWVIDTSGSMGEEQEKLAENLPLFHSELTRTNLEWHVAVTTTDLTRDNGRLREVVGTPVITNHTPHQQVLFEMLARVGSGGSDVEQGLQAAFLALSQPTRELQQANAGFYRDDAALHVIVVSDEDDQSHGLIETAELTQWLLQLKPDPETDVTFNSIVGPGPSGCSGRDGTADYGSRYVSMTNRVGGISWSICDDDWSTVLTALGAQAAGQRKEFFLSKVPVPGTVRVAVRTATERWRGAQVDGPDGVAAACAGDAGCFGFTWNEVRNSVSFVDFVPVPGAEVRVRYVPFDEGGGW